MAVTKPQEPEVYRLGLRLPRELGKRLRDAAWNAHESVQAYVELAITERIQADETLN